MTATPPILSHKAISGFPHVQDVTTPTGNFIYKFTPSAASSFYNQKVLASFGLPVVPMEKGSSQEAAEALSLPQYASQELIVMPKLAGKTLRDNGGKGLGDRTADYLVAAVLTNNFDMKADNIFDDGTIIDTERGMFQNPQTVLPVDKLFVMMTSQPEAFPHFHKQTMRKPLERALKKAEDNINNSALGTAAEFRETYDTLKQRAKDMRKVVEKLSNKNTLK